MPHRAGRVGDAELGARLRDRGLRRDAAGPEHRQLVAHHINRVAVVGQRQVLDADQRRVAQVHRRAVHVGESRRDLDRANRRRCAQRPHRDHHRPVERPGGDGRDARAVHRDVAVLVDVAHREARVEQRLLERERAADDEGHEVVAPLRRDVGRLVDELAPPPDAVARHIAADVDVGAKRGEHRVAGLGHREQRARLGVALAVAQKVLGVRARQDDDVALHMVAGEAAGVRGPRAAADRRARFGNRCRGRVERRALLDSRLHSLPRSRRCVGLGRIVLLGTGPIKQEIFRLSHRFFR